MLEAMTSEPVADICECCINRLLLDAAADGTAAGESRSAQGVATMVFLIIALVGTSISKFFPGQPRGSQSTLGAGLRGSQFADKTSASAQSFDW